MKKSPLLLTSLIALGLMVVAFGWGQAGAQDVVDSAETASPFTAPEDALGSGISYQGQLNDGGTTASGSYDFQFTLYDAVTGGSIVGFPTNQTLTVADGLFHAENLIFGDFAFTGKAVWMEVRVRSAGSGSYTTLTPRQQILGAPYAIGLKPNAKIIGAFDDYGLYLEDSSTSGITSGVYSYTRNSSGRALAGIQANTSATGSGVYGEANSANGIGLFGANWATSGNAYGILGRTNSTTGVGVFGLNQGSGGSGIGVHGKTNTLDGAGVYAENTVDYGLDLILAGSANTTRGDDGRIGSDPAYAGSDIILMSNDGVFVYLDSNGNETGEFAIYDDQEIERFGFFETGELRLHDANDVETIEILTTESDTGGQITLRNDAGVSTIIIDAEYGNGGNGRITTEVVEITGGADLSEQFDVRGDVQPGMVVSIDPENPGQLVVSNETYDRKVAGIVSGAGGVQPGLLMGQAGSVADGEYPIALTGRVYVWADATMGAIEPGDLLTTSAEPGYVMAVRDYEQAQGAIIGKAMQGLESGQGLILVLVSLQ